MEDESIDIEKIVDHWISRSDRDFDTMEHLIRTEFRWLDTISTFKQLRVDQKEAINITKKYLESIMVNLTIAMNAEVERDSDIHHVIRIMR